MGLNREKTRNKYPSNHSLSHERGSERSTARQLNEQGGVSKQVSGASEQANGQVSSLVLQSVFLAILDHSAMGFVFFHGNCHGKIYDDINGIERLSWVYPDTVLSFTKFISGIHFGIHKLIQ